MHTIAIVGPGQMGTGIAQAAAASGYRVLLAGRDIERTRHAIGQIGKVLGRLVEKEKISSEQRDGTIRNIEAVEDFAPFGEADLIIETVAELENLKAEVLRRLTGIVSDNAIIASNTSSLSITRLAKYTPAPAMFVGLHFFHPAPLMGLVEVVSGLATAAETKDAVAKFAESLGKVAVHVTDSPGFVVNRLLIPMLNEAVFALSEGVASMESIDAAVKLGLNHPMGPLTLADFIGLDTCLEICRVLYAGTGDQKFRPAPLLVNYVEAGWLGRKAGRGFYDYSDERPVATR